MSGATSAPCRKDTSRILHVVTRACSSTCTLSSPTHPSAKSPCFGRTLTSTIDPNQPTTTIFIPVLHIKKPVLLMYMYISGCIFILGHLLIAASC